MGFIDTACNWASSTKIMQLNFSLKQIERLSPKRFVRLKNKSFIIYTYKAVNNLSEMERVKFVLQLEVLLFPLQDLFVAIDQREREEMSG